MERHVGRCEGKVDTHFPQGNQRIEKIRSIFCVCVCWVSFFPVMLLILYGEPLHIIFLTHSTHSHTSLVSITCFFILHNGREEGFIYFLLHYFQRICICMNGSSHCASAIHHSSSFPSCSLETFFYSTSGITNHKGSWSSGFSFLQFF